jgi:hypothetical protein
MPLQSFQHFEVQSGSRSVDDAAPSHWRMALGCEGIIGKVRYGQARSGSAGQGGTWAVNSLKHRVRCLGMRSASMACSGLVWYDMVWLGGAWLGVGCQQQVVLFQRAQPDAISISGAVMQGAARLGVAGRGWARRGKPWAENSTDPLQPRWIGNVFTMTRHRVGRPDLTRRKCGDGKYDRTMDRVPI